MNENSGKTGDRENKTEQGNEIKQNITVTDHNISASLFRTPSFAQANTTHIIFRKYLFFLFF